MSSVHSATAQIGPNASHFVALSTTGRFFPDDLTTYPNAAAVGTGGVTAIVGSSIFFSNPTTAGTAVGDSAVGSAALVVGQLFRDMGKVVHIYAANTTSGVQQLYAVLNRVRRIATGTTSEGDNGSLGYIVTWSAPGSNPTVNVARVGSGPSA